MDTMKQQMINVLMMSEAPDHWVLDEMTGRYFKSNLNELQRVEVDLNRIIEQNGYACLNDLYDLMDVPGCTLGDELGWAQAAVNFRFGTVLAPDDSPAISFCPDRIPTNGFTEF